MFPGVSVAGAAQLCVGRLERWQRDRSKMHWRKNLRVVLGAVALGFAAFLVLVSVIAMVAPEKLPALMEMGAVVWVLFGVALYPVSCLLFPNKPN